MSADLIDQLDQAGASRVIRRMQRLHDRCSVPPRGLMRKRTRQLVRRDAVARTRTAAWWMATVGAFALMALVWYVGLRNMADQLGPTKGERDGGSGTSLISTE